MGVLDQVTELRNQGMGDDEIIQTLQEKGIPPKLINDALNNEQIKKAVSDEYQPPTPSEQTEEQPAPQENHQDQVYSPQAPQQQEYYSPQDYQQPGYEQQQGFDSSTIIEIAEQVFAERMQKTQRQIDQMMEFRSITEGKMESISERLKRIEMTMDKLQIAILEKVGSYGSNLESIKKEMSMMQDTFGKVAGNSPKQVVQQRQQSNPTNNNQENFSKQQKQFSKRIEKE